MNYSNFYKSVFCMAATIAAPLASALAQNSDKIVGWGDNSYGQTNVPATLTNAVTIAAGSAHNLALRTDGTVAAWGANDAGQTNVPTGLSNVIAIAAGGGQSLALKSDGTVVGWGMPPVPVGLNNVTAIARGTFHGLALRSNGTVVVWGDNSYGQTNVPANLSGVRAIAAGYDHSLALKSNGTVVAWGTNNGGQITVPAGLSGVTAISAGYEYSLALKADGTVVGWGIDPYGQVSLAPSLRNVRAIAAGFSHAVALESNGTVIVWGGNYFGQANVPAGLSNVVAIAASGDHSLALSGGLLGIIAAPSNQVLIAGSPVDLRVVVLGIPPLSYQWFLNGTNAIPGATNALLPLGNVQPSQSGVYTALATNISGSITSPPALLSVVGIPPSIVTQPANQSASAGFAVDFSVAASGSTPLGYQWFFDDTNSIGGATGTTLHLANVQSSQSGTYTVVVTNAYGSVTSSPATLSVVGVPPSMLTQPANQTAWPGFTVDFYATASGSTPLVYQWFFNGTNSLGGAIGTTLHLVNVQPFQAGTYAVIVTNAFGRVTSSVATLNLVPSNTVPVASEAFLRAAIASGAGTVTFACDGTITLGDTLTIGTNTALDGTGHQVTISGGSGVRVFSLQSNAILSLTSLTIANGSATNGSGVLNNQGTVNATNCFFSGNSFISSGYSNAPFGGGLCNIGGTVLLDGCVFANNILQGSGGIYGGNYGAGTPGYDAKGAAVYNGVGGMLSVYRCAFLANSAKGGNGGAGAGASFWPGLGYNGAAGGVGCGGAIYNTGTMQAEASLFANNTVSGGNGGNGGNTINDKTSYPGGAGATGGDGAGGAIFNSGIAALINCTLAANQGMGGNGGWGGSASDQNSHYPGGPTGYDGSGGAGFAAVSDQGSLSLTNCTVALNAGSGGAAGRAQGGTPPSGPANGGLNSAARLVNTLLAANSPANGSGQLIDLGHNLSSDNSCGLTSTGSMNNTDPKLGPLANNGGPTLTLALLSGSPAIDAADPLAAPLTDQRGVSRPVGPAPDIGAFEYGLPAVLRISGSQASGINIVAFSYPGYSCRLFVSSNLLDWTPIATNQIGSDGTYLFHDNCPLGGTCRFYRLVTP